MDAKTFYRNFVRVLLFTFVLSVEVGSSLAQAWPNGVGPLVSVVKSRQPSAVRTQNFIVICADAEFASRVSQAAEKQRHELAMYWLGRPLPAWPQPCPITVSASPNLGAGGSTTFSPGNRTIRNWRMNVSGSQERILDSVLPHEITHTILASHFAPMNKTVPRWADEGACTTIEHGSERSKHEQFLVRFLTSGRGIPFATMFTLKDYPADIMPLYAQGYSVTSFLIAQGGPQHFVKFLEAGMSNENWVLATEEYYGYPMIGKLQTAWNKWVYDGGGDVSRHTADALLVSRKSIQQASVGIRNLENARVANNQTVVSQPIQIAADTSRRPTTVADSASSGSSEVSWYRQQLDRTLQSQPVENPSTSLTMPSDPPSVGNAKNPSRSDQDYSVSHARPPESLGQSVYR